MIWVRAERELNGDSNGAGAIFAQIRGSRIRGHAYLSKEMCTADVLVNI